MRRLLVMLAVLAGAAIGVGVLASFAGTASAGPTCTIFWTGRTSTSWTVNGNWSFSDGGTTATRTPNNTDFACSSTTPVRTVIVASSANRTVGGLALTTTSLNLQGGTLTLSTSPSTINALQIDGGGIAGAAPLTLTGNSIAQSSTITFTGASKTIASGASFNATVDVYVGTPGGGAAATSLANNGSFTISQAGVYLATTTNSNTSASLVNSGTMTLANGADVSANGTGTKAPTFVDSGTLVSSGPNPNSVNVPFTNTGTVQVSGSSLSVTATNANAQPDTGSWNTGNAPGTGVVLNGPARVVSSGSFTGSGGVIVNGGSESFASTVTIAGLEFDAGTISGSPTVANLVANGGTYTGGGTLTTTGTSTLCGLIIDNGARLLNNGNATYTGGCSYLRLTNGGRFENNGTLTLTSTNYNDINDDGNAGASFVNDAGATLNAAATAGGTYIDTYFTNSGTVNVTQGTLGLDYGNVATTTDTGTYTLATGTTLTFAGGNRTVDTGTVTGAGTLAVAGGTTTFAHNPSVSNLALTGGAVTGSATTSTLTTTTYGGGLTGTGTLTVTGNSGLCGLTVNGGYRLLNQGAMTLNTDCYYTQLAGGSTLENAGTLTFINTNGYGISSDNNANNAVLNDVGGTVTVNLVDNTRSVDIDPAFTNHGTVKMTVGNLALYSGTVTGSVDDGTYTVAAGTTLTFTGGNRTVDSGTVTGAGTLSVAAGTTTFAHNPSVSNLALTGGTVTGSATTGTLTTTTYGGGLAGTGTLTVTGNSGLCGLTVNGGYRLLNQGAMTLNTDCYYTQLGGGSTFENAGTLNFINSGTYGISSDNNANNAVLNDTGAILTVSLADNTRYAEIVPAFTNHGTVTVTTGIFYLDGGTVTGSVDDGTYTVAAGTTVTFASGNRTVDTGTVTGAGTLAIAAGTTTFAHNPNVSNLALTGGTVTGSATTGTLTATTSAGGLTGTGTLTLTGNSGLCGLTISGGYRLLNQGAMTLNTDCYYTQLAGGSTLENAGTLTLINTNAYGIYSDNNPGNAVLNDTGATLTVNLATTNTVEIAPAVTNNGTVSAAKGTLQLDAVGNLSGSGVLTGGTWATSGGAIQLPTALTTNAATISIGATGNGLQTSSGNALASLTSNTGSLTTAQNQALNGQLTNGGTVAVVGGQLTVSKYVQTAGTTTVTGTAKLKSGASGTAAVTINGGTLAGTGTVLGAITSTGTVAPGTGGTGALTVTGSYGAQTGGTFATTAGSTATNAVVSGAITLNGTLAITTASPAPAVGTTVTVLSGGSRSGTFSAVTGANVPGVGTWTVGYTSTGVTLTLTAAAPSPQVSVSGASTPEGNSGTTSLPFTVTLSAASSSTVTVNYATGGGTATAGADYVATSGLLSFPAGSTSQTVNVVVNGDTVYENDETVGLTLSSPSGATLGTASATGTVTNDDAPPAVSIADASGTTSSAGGSTITFPVTLSAASALPAQVSYATSDVTATAPGDYTATSGTLIIPAGSTSGSVMVTVPAQSAPGSPKTFRVILTNPVNATLGIATGTGTITNTNASTPPTVTSVSPNTGAPGSAIAVTITGANLAAGSTVSVSGSGVTASAVTVVSSSQITATFTVASSAPIGARDVTVTGPTQGAATCTGCFTVTNQLSVTTLSRTTLATGNTDVLITVTGSGFVPGSAFTLTRGAATITATSVQVDSASSLTAVVSVASTAATGAWSPVVTNPDGSTASKPNAVTIVAAPTVKTVTPASAARGTSVNVTITGTGYVSGLVVSVAGCSVSNVTVVSATSITATVFVPANATTGTKVVKVFNPASAGNGVGSASKFKVT